VRLARGEGGEKRSAFGIESRDERRGVDRSIDRCNVCLSNTSSCSSRFAPSPFLAPSPPFLSHDQHLLTSCCKEILVVEKGRVERLAAGVDGQQGAFNAYKKAVVAGKR